MGRKRKIKPTDFTPQGVMIASPYRNTLLACVEEAYALFGLGHVSHQLEVCFCGVCMTEAIRQRIISTPNRGLGSDLIQEYSNSAHGDVVNTDDLRLLLPRYIELMSDEQSVKYTESSDVLWRFGMARRKQGFLSAAEVDFLNRWAGAMMLHFAWADKTDEGSLQTPFSVMIMMVAGGWPLGAVVAAMCDCFAQPEFGAHAVAQFVRHLWDDRLTGDFKLDIIFDRGIAEGVLQGVEAWFLSDAFLAIMQTAAQAELPELAQLNLKIGMERAISARAMLP